MSPRPERIDPASAVSRRSRPGDGEMLAAHMADPAVFPGVLQMPHATPPEWETRLERNMGDDANVHLLCLVGDELAGSAGIHRHARPRTLHAAGIGMTVSGAWQGRGVGSLLMDALLDVADNWWGLTRVELTVYVDNAHAIALYEKHGFEREGVLRQYALRDGRLVDALAMARLRPAPTPA
jgi:putative acetyltransferase